ncbi:hypothetical protein HK100_003826, partial [Physocladia obscura]
MADSDMLAESSPGLAMQDLRAAGENLTGSGENFTHSDLALEAGKKLKSSKKDDNTRELFASFATFRANPTRIKLLWIILKSGALVALLLSVLIRLSSHSYKASLIDGHWSLKNTWLPNTCAKAIYPPQTTSKCLTNTRIFLFGDSSMRAIFYAFRRSLGQRESDFAAERDLRHADITITVKNVTINFYWDPWLNRTDVVEALLNPKPSVFASVDGNEVADATSGTLRTSLAMFSVGSWFMRYGGEQIGADGAIERRLFGKATQLLKNEIEEKAAIAPIADSIIVRLIPPYDEALLSDERKQFLKNEIRHLYNSKLFDLDLSKNIELGSIGFHALSAADGMTMDGLHYLPEVDNVETMEFIDRTNLFVKVNKEFSLLEFTLLNLCWIIPGFWTIRIGKDSTFLNRDQTDEWKGWMQFAILVYHYTGGSKIIPIYSVIRVLVASYLFMTGFGHFTFFYKKSDFSLIRVARVVVRLNILSIVLSYVMQTDTLFYYFGPLVTFWFTVVYATMRVYPAGNLNPTILAIKLIASAAAGYVFTHDQRVYEPFFTVFETVFGVRWNAHEAVFRLALDQYAVHFGMIAAWVMISIKSVDGSGTVVSGYNWLLGVSSAVVNQWANVKRIVLVISVLILCCYAIALAVVPLTKVENNAWHPYVSLLVLGAFVVLRNANESLRCGSSVFWRWIGSFSLETFILQYHFWMGVDTYGLLDLWGPGVMGSSIDKGLASILKWSGFLASTILFLGLSEIVSDVSGALVEAIVVGSVGKKPEWKDVLLRVG